MSGNIVTPSTAGAYTPSRAARELGLKRGEFDLAADLGLVRTVPDEGGGGRRVTRAEIDRLRGEDGFPETLLKRVEVVGTTAGAALLEVSSGRFTRLARLGMIVPVRFYLNRYRAVVWLYLTDELRQFAADEDNTPLLSGRTPADLRQKLEQGMDARPRNWRGRRLGFLTRQAAGHPWAKAAAVASMLDPVQVADIVKDPYEHAHLSRFLPKPVSYGAPNSPSAQLAERILKADEPDEIGWFRADLAHALDIARTQHPAPRPRPAPQTREERMHPVPAAAEQAPPAVDAGEHSRGLLGWLRRRNS
ncbi:DUF6397 family protein [Streptomyces sp. NPDC006476]|uniref:DUF6397 family protein n=1 Tax=Streptomyces sp. NPDC006476 TaxID=3157175 RepID=UPI00339FBEA9